MKKRFWYFFSLWLLMIGLGLLSRSSWVNLPEEVDFFLGDTIWGSMVFFFMGTLFPYWSYAKITSAALVFAYLVEFSQLIKHDFLMYLRSFKLIALVIGHDFSVADLLFYSIGIGLALGVTLYVDSRLSLSLK